MKPLNVLVPPGVLVAGTTIALEDSEAHHLRVRRAATDASLTLFDGEGATATGTQHADGKSVAVLVGAVQHFPRPPLTVLAVGAGDKERFLAVSERCTELGVTHLVPLRTDRTQAVDTRFRDSSIDKARRRAREACKQCENPWATVIEESCSLTELAERHAGVHWHLGAVGGTRCPAFGVDQSVGWLIGPEGGFSDDELALAVGGLSALSVSFGPSILRFDTAAVAAAAMTLDRRRTT